MGGLVGENNSKIADGRHFENKIDISPYLSEKSSDFHEILYTAADLELDERHVIKKENFQNSRWRTAAILKIVISPYLSEK